MNSILTNFQKEVLDKLSQNKFLTDNYYFSGGTVLSEFYLHHRLSEDFDFFTDQEIEQDTIRANLEPDFKKIGIESLDYQEVTSTKIFFLKRGQRETIKTEFNFWAFERLEKGKKFNLLAIDSLLDIAVNKLHTLLSRKKARDFVDFYFICKTHDYTLETLQENLKKKYDWIVDPLYLAARLLEVKNVTDYPRMIKNFSKQALLDFYLTLAKAQKEKIINCQA